MRRTPGNTKWLSLLGCDFSRALVRLSKESSTGSANGGLKALDELRGVGGAKRALAIILQLTFTFCILFEAMPSGRSHPRYDAVFHSLIEANVEADVRSHHKYCISDCSSQIHESLRPAWSAAFAHSLSMSDVGGL